MPGPITQLLEAQHDPTEVPVRARRPRRSLPVSGTLLAWTLGIPTLWTAGMVALAVSVRF